MFNAEMASCAAELKLKLQRAFESSSERLLPGPRCPFSLLTSHLWLMFLVFCLSCAPRPFSPPFLTHTHPGKDESSHLCTPPPHTLVSSPLPWFYSTATTAFSTGSIFVLILSSLLCRSPFSHFSSLPPSPLQGADQFTVFLGGVRNPHPPHPSTHCHP